MKILFFTPALVVSAIGRVSSLVVAQLVLQGHEVIVVRSEEPSLFEKETHDFPCQVVHWNRFEEIRHIAEQSELLVYQIGNNYQYHQGCLEWLPKMPGLVVLHDNFLGSMFWSWSEIIGRPQALAQLAAMYGSDVPPRFFDHADACSFISYASQHAPMTEWITGMASAVVMHSSWGLDRVLRSCAGPVEVVPLPYDAPHFESTLSNVKSKVEQKVTVLTIGHVNKNKRHESVIRAIGSSERLLKTITYRIVGLVTPEHAQELQSLANKLKVNIVIIGEVDDAMLAQEISSADVICCLRWPVLEAASASTIEAMLYAKPVIVTNAGFYRDLPNDCVVKINTDSEIADLSATLEKLVALPDERKALGQLARAYALKTFRADNYAAQIVAMPKQINRSKLIASSAQVFSSMLLRWGSKGDSKILESVAEPLNLFR